MQNELLPEEAYLDLPPENDRKFVQLMSLAQANLAGFLSGTGSSEYDSEYAWELRTQFMEIGRALADEFGLPGLPDPDEEYNNADARYSDFLRKLSGIFARVRARHGTPTAQPDSVKLGHKTKAWLRQEIEQLRVYINDSEIPASKKSALIDKLEDMLAELDKQRLSFARTMAIAASIAGILGGGTTTIVQAPKVYEMINHLIARIGEDKAREDAELLRIEGPAKALPPPTQQRLPLGAPPAAGGYAAKPSRPEDFDDDVPF